MDVQDFKGEFSQGSLPHALPPSKITLDLLLYIFLLHSCGKLSLLLSKSPSVLSRVLYFSRPFCIFNYSLPKDITPFSTGSLLPNYKHAYPSSPIPKNLINLCMCLAKF